MDKRFQVFVSSTYEDLRIERQEVIQALLELDCIPCGMELFPASNEHQWDFIKRIIRDCDYYMVILAGRYGSIGPSGVGYTEMEYDFAQEIAKPSIAFLHREPDQLPAKVTERTTEGQGRLQQFRSKLQERLCKHWASPTELGSVVSRSLVQLIRTCPASGWVRHGEAGDPLEAARLRTRVDELELELSSLMTTGPKGIQDLAQGGDTYNTEFTFRTYLSSTYTDTATGLIKVSMTWNDIVRLVLPNLVPEGTSGEIGLALVRFAGLQPTEYGLPHIPADGSQKLEIHITEPCLRQVIVQLQSLCLITPSVRSRSLRNQYDYWTLTPYGQSTMTRLCALRRS